MGLGVDFGGTKIEAVWLTPEGEERGRTRVKTPRDYEGSVRAIAGLARAVAEAAGVPPGPVGVGIPGSISPQTGLVRNGNATWLLGHPLDRDLAQALGQPVRVENDANCMVLSEAVDGAAAGAASVFGVILGTGVGGGLVIDGRIVSGANGLGGEWGHIPLVATTPEELNGPRCFCGKQGCIEVWLAGPGLSAEHVRVTGTAPPLTPHEIVERAAAGDAGAKAALDRHVARLGRMLGLIVNVIDPEVIVLAGGLSNMAHLYTDLVPAIAPHVLEGWGNMALRRAVHGDSSGVRGAARLWEAR